MFHIFVVQKDEEKLKTRLGYANLKKKEEKNQFAKSEKMWLGQ